jgi:hypothetical protein
MTSYPDWLGLTVWLWSLFDAESLLFTLQSVTLTKQDDVNEKGCMADPVI